MLPWISSFLMYMSWWMDAAVYFVYDLSPIVVTIKENRRNFGHFITRLCAVLGGTFAVTGTGFVLRFHSMHTWKLCHSLTSRIPLYMYLEVSDSSRFFRFLNWKKLWICMQFDNGWSLFTIFICELSCDQVSQYLSSSILWNRYVGQVDVSDYWVHAEIRKGRSFLSFFPAF